MSQQHLLIGLFLIIMGFAMMIMAVVYHKTQIESFMVMLWYTIYTRFIPVIHKQSNQKSIEHRFYKSVFFNCFACNFVCWNYAILYHI